MRLRYGILVVGAVSALLIYGLLLNPDGDTLGGFLRMGLSVATMLVLVVAISMAHVVRKALFDYLDMGEMQRTAAQTPEGAGMVFRGVCTVLAALIIVFGAGAILSFAHAQVPAQALVHIPALKQAIDDHWPGHPYRPYFAGLIDHESACPRVRSCWSPVAELRTQREQGVGFGQITRTWTLAGLPRFDALAEMRDRHSALGEFDWATVRDRPDLQLLAVVLKSRDDWRALAGVRDVWQRLLMTDLAYNMGSGRIAKDRRLCHVTPDCDSQRWWGHVEKTCTASQRPLYGTRSACDIGRHHVRDVVTVRAPRYAGLL